MIISLLLGLGSLIVSLLGLKCIKIGSTTDQSKAKITITGGILSILCGESALEVRAQDRTLFPFHKFAE